MPMHILVLDPTDCLDQHPVLDSKTLVEAGYPAIQVHRTRNEPQIRDWHAWIGAVALWVAPDEAGDEASLGMPRAIPDIPCLAVGVADEERVRAYLGAGYLEIRSTGPTSVAALHADLQRAQARQAYLQRSIIGSHPGTQGAPDSLVDGMRQARAGGAIGAPGAPSDDPTRLALTLLMDQVAVPILIRDAQGRILGFNRICQELTGHSESAVLNCRLRDIVELPVSPAIGVESCDDETALAEVRDSGGPRHCETHWRLPDGTERRIAWVHQGLKGTHGTIECILSTGWDVTEREQTIAHQHQTLLELAHKARICSVGEMASQIGHEITQPIGAIAMTADSLEGLCTGEESGLVEQGLLDIVNQANRALRFLRWIRDFSRSESEDRAPISFPEVIDGVLPILSPSLRRRGIRVEQEIAPGVPAVVGDRVLLQQVLLNLLLNAIDAMVENGGERILIRVAPEGSGAHLEVQDSGPGISEAAWDSLFQSFYTTKPQGLGLGLAVSARLVDDHQGRIQAYNLPEGGANFVVYLPAAVKPEAEVAGIAPD